MLGPVPCQGCQRAVIWNGKQWRNPGQRGRNNPHTCQDGARCGAFMPYLRERCARMAGHAFEHRSRYSLDNKARAKWVGRLA